MNIFVFFFIQNVVLPIFIIFYNVIEEYIKYSRYKSVQINGNTKFIRNFCESSKLCRL